MWPGMKIVHGRARRHPQSQGSTERANSDIKKMIECANGRCSCKKAKLLCNSRCHASNQNCKNKKINALFHLNILLLYLISLIY
jgi:hypothetical protein